MQKSLLKKSLGIIIAALIFTSCSHAPVEQYSTFNEYLPTSSETQPQQIEQTLPQGSACESAETSKNETDVWDVSNVDVSYVAKDKKLMAFTFDDAPARTLENILAVFAAFNETHPNCPATATIFFNGGRFNQQTKHLLYAACALGFELGNHTHSHLDLTMLSEREIEYEISATDALLSEIDHSPLHLLRAPFGKTNELIKSLAKTPIIDWNVDTLDWTGIDENKIYEQVFSNRQDGSIVLMHDGYQATVSALKRLLPDLEKEGYQIVSVSALAKAHNCNLRRGRVYIRARQQT